MSELIEALRAIATRWRAGNLEHHGGVVLVWQGSVYGWKNSLRDASHERPGAYAIDEAGHVFVAEGGDDYNGAKCWVVADPDNDQQQTEADRIAGQFETLRDEAVAAEYRNDLSDDEVAELRTQMAVLSSQYFNLTGEALK